MADSSTATDMEAMPVNPVIQMSEDISPLQMHAAHESTPPHLLHYAGWDEDSAKTASKSIDAALDFHDKSSSPRGYTSEEEPPSPTDNDDAGYVFTSSDSESTHSFDGTESLFEHTNATQLCIKAQPVQFVSAGRAKVICVPSSPESSSVESSPRFTHEGIDRAAVFGSSKMHRRSPDRSPQARPTTSPQTAPAFRSRAIRRMPNLPRLDAAPTSAPTLPKQSQTPLASQRANLSRQDPFPSNWPLASPTSPSSPRRRLPRLATTFGIRGLGVPRRGNSCSSNSSANTEDEYRLEPRSPHAISPFPDINYTPRAMTTPKPRMVPRGANERAPPLVLPPCPDDYVDDADVDYSLRWPLRDDSDLNTSRLDRMSPLKHLRRKSLSAAFATAYT